MKIDILDEGYWSPEVFRAYQVMTSMTGRGFGRPRQVLGGLMGQGEGAHQPTKGLVPTQPQPIKSSGAGGLSRWTSGTLSVVPEQFR